MPPADVKSVSDLIFSDSTPRSDAERGRYVVRPGSVRDVRVYGGCMLILEDD